MQKEEGTGAKYYNIYGRMWPFFVIDSALLQMPSFKILWAWLLYFLTHQ